MKYTKMGQLERGRIQGVVLVNNNRLLNVSSEKVKAKVVTRR